MGKNESTTDRLIRAGIAVGAGVLAANVGKAKSPGRMALCIVSSGMGLTAAVGVCPIYSVLGISPCDDCKKK